MNSRTNLPKKHHYIPRLILSNFADRNGQLWFHRREWSSDKVLRINYQHLFAENHLYSMEADDGTRDPALELFFSQQLESEAANFLRRIFEIVRQGGTPNLTEGAWDLWWHFYYYQIKRTPAYIASVAERSGFRETVKAGLQRDGMLGPNGENPDEERRQYKNAIVYAQATPPRDEILTVFAERGLAVFVIDKPRRSFILGDVPGASARLGNASPISQAGLEIFIPVAPDIALGIVDRPKAVSVFKVQDEQIRRMNVATAERSTILAGTSRDLLLSMAQRTSYKGIVSPAEDHAVVQRFSKLFGRDVDQ